MNCKYFMIVTITLLPFSMALFQEQESEKSDDKIVIPHRDENTIARRDFMRTKLLYSQNIFEGMTTGNTELIKQGIEEVQSITKAEQWVAIDDVRYQKLTDEFNTAVKRLETAAKSGNLEAIALRYYQMSTNCIDCHQHIRKADYEF